MRLIRALLLHALAIGALWPLGLVRRCGADAGRLRALCTGGRMAQAALLLHPVLWSGVGAPAERPGVGPPAVRARAVPHRQDLILCQRR